MIGNAKTGIRRVFLMLSMILFLSSLFFEALPGHPGYVVLGLGWAQFVAVYEVGPFVAFAWFANPLLFEAWILEYSKGRYARQASQIVACMAACLGLGYIIFGKVIVTNESGGASTAVTLTLGYELWISSILVATAGTFLPVGKKEFCE